MQPPVHKQAFPWWLAMAVAIAVAVAVFVATSDLYAQVFATVAAGIGVTVFVTIVGFALASLLGLGVAREHAACVAQCVPDQTHLGSTLSSIWMTHQPIRIAD